MNTADNCLQSWHMKQACKLLADEEGPYGFLYYRCLQVCDCISGMFPNCTVFLRRSLLSRVPTLSAKYYTVLEGNYQQMQCGVMWCCTFSLKKNPNHTTLYFPMCSQWKRSIHSSNCLNVQSSVLFLFKSMETLFHPSGEKNWSDV